MIFVMQGGLILAGNDEITHCFPTRNAMELVQLFAKGCKSCCAPLKSRVLNEIAWISLNLS